MELTLRSAAAVMPHDSQPEPANNDVTVVAPCDNNNTATDKGKCMPKCTWSCESNESSPICEQECAPKCLAPECQTRCPSLDSVELKDFGCKVTCDKPNCTVECPKKGCGGSECAACKTVCHAPKCEIKCQEPSIDCHQVCKEPLCNWECKQPDEAACPSPKPPKCQMHCEAPNGCMQIGVDMPPLEKEQMVITAYNTNATTLLQHSGERTISVNVLRAVKVAGTSQLQLVPDAIALPYE